MLKCFHFVNVNASFGVNCLLCLDWDCVASMYCTKDRPKPPSLNKLVEIIGILQPFVSHSSSKTEEMEEDRDEPQFDLSQGVVKYLMYVLMLYCQLFPLFICRPFTSYSLFV